MDDIDKILDNIQLIYKRQQDINDIIEIINEEDFIIVAIPKSKVKN